MSNTFYVIKKFLNKYYVIEDDQSKYHVLGGVDNEYHYDLDSADPPITDRSPSFDTIEEAWDSLLKEDAPSSAMPVVVHSSCDTVDVSFPDDEARLQDLENKVNVLFDFLLSKVSGEEAYILQKEFNNED